MGSADIARTPPPFRRESRELQRQPGRHRQSSGHRSTPGAQSRGFAASGAHRRRELRDAACNGQPRRQHRSQRGGGRGTHAPSAITEEHHRRRFLTWAANAAAPPPSRRPTTAADGRERRSGRPRATVLPPPPLAGPRPRREGRHTRAGKLGDRARPPRGKGGGGSAAPRPARRRALTQVVPPQQAGLLQPQAPLPHVPQQVGAAAPGHGPARGRALRCCRPRRAITMETGARLAPRHRRAATGRAAERASQRQRQRRGRRRLRAPPPGRPAPAEPRLRERGGGGAA